MAFSLGTSFEAAKPAFSFGSNTATTTMSSGFGGFGTTATSSAPGFGGFGTSTNTGSTFGALGGTPASTAPSLFGAGGFGSTAAKPTTGFGTGAFGSTGFGTNTSGFGTGTSTFGSTAPTFGSTAPTFGSTAPTFGSTAPTFGTNTGTTGLFGTAPTFGTGTAFGAGTSTFGTGASTFGTGTSTFGTGTSTFGTGTSAFGTGGFGTGFGAKPAGTFGGFGTNFGTAPAFGQQQLQPQQQQQQQGPSSAQEALVAAVSNCQVFGDERDQVMAKWNLLQAQWGSGKAYYSSTAPPLELSEQNPLCRFKAVGYSRLGGRDDKDGIVSLIFLKKEEEVKANQQQLISSLAGLLGSKPNLTVHVEAAKAVSDSRTQVMIYVTDSGVSSGLLGAPPPAPAAAARVSATELAGFLNSASPRAALTAAGCVAVAPVTRASHQTLQLYLQTAPPGMDIRLWKQAQADNPDPDNYIPVPIVGFSEIKWRTRCQSEQTGLQAGFLRQAGEQLAQLRVRRAACAARLAQLAPALHALQHTLLQVVARQEVLTRAGSSLSAEEESVRSRLHELASHLTVPPLYGGRLNEMLSAVRLQRSTSGGGAPERYHLDPGAQEDMKQFLVLQQQSLAHLMETARADLAALNNISQEMTRMVEGA